MQCRRVQCPGCGVLLELPPGCAGCVVRCGSCRARFAVPSTIRVTDDAIVSWLGQGEEEEALERTEGPPEKDIDLVPEVPPSGDTMVLPAIGGHLRLVNVDRRGALFEFPFDKLLDPDFRCAMPRRCLQCGARAHLHAHVIIFTERFKDSFSIEAEHAVGALESKDKDLQSLDGEELLERLPHVPNVPHPGDLPMPYWVCDRCSGAGAVGGQIQINARTGKGWCRLGIRNLRRAEEFLTAAGAKDSPDHAKLQEQIRTMTENPWDALPLPVRHRLEQWFRPTEDERFVTYVPDRDRFPSEDGMAGLIISNRRLIYHAQRIHGEVPAGDPLELRLSMSGRKGNLQLNAPTCRIRHFCVDRDGVGKLRRGLAATKFRVAWK